MKQYVEEWKDILEFSGRYEVSNLGRVRSFVTFDADGMPRILKLRPDTHGYLRAHLTKDGRAYDRLAHRLVMEAFVGTRPPGKEINHIDGIKANNALGNLEYITRSDNQKHAFRLGLQIGVGRSNPGSLHGNAKLTEIDIPIIRDLARSMSNPQIAKLYNVSVATIQRIVTYNSWKHVA